MSLPLRPPHLRHRLPAHEAGKATWLELFYDLVFVAVFIQISDLLSHDITTTWSSASAP